jgi:hypothetical protein
MLIFTLFILLGFNAGDRSPQQPDLAKHFSGLDGAFVLYDAKNQNIIATMKTLRRALFTVLDV